MKIFQQKALFTICFGVVWCVGVAFGLRAVLNYEIGAGTVGTVPQQWPAKSQIHRPTDRMTLVMLAHPRCPCTDATMGELAQIMAGVQGKVSAYVLFYKPKGSGAEWDQTALRRSAEAIPGVTVLSDVDGIEARRFGAETSGHTLLFDRNGRLLFSGGITDSRGHAGGNNGESAIVALANNRQPGQTRSLVFGCKISDHTGAMEAGCSK